MNEADIRAIVAEEVAKATLARAQQVEALTIAMLAMVSWRESLTQSMKRQSW